MVACDAARAGGARAARKLLHDDFKKRWLEDMPDTQRAELDIATLLDPRFKTYVFPGCTTDLDEAKDTAMASLKGVWTLDWKPAAAAAAPAAAPAAAAPAPAAITTASATAAAKMGASSSFFAMPLAPMLAPAAAAPMQAPAQDDLDKYLALPAEANMDLDVLAWWKARDYTHRANPATGQPEGLPALAKMARHDVSSSAARRRQRASSACSPRRASSMMMLRRARTTTSLRLPCLPLPTQNECVGCCS